MQIFKDTCKYLKKSFWFLAIVAIVPSIILSFFAKPFSNITFLPSLFVGRTDYNFTEVFMLMFTPIYGASVFEGLIGHVVFFVSLWLACVVGITMVDKHLKTGELTLKVEKYNVASYLLPVLLSLVIWAVVYLVAIVAQSGLLSLIHYICGVTPPSAIDCILSTLVSLLIFVGILYGSIYLMFVPLNMVYYGYGPREAILESSRLVSDKPGNMVSGFIIPITVLIVINLIFSLVTSLLTTYAGMSMTARYWIDYVFSVATHLMIIVYLIAYVIVAFYNLSNLERRDIKRYQRRR